MNKEEKKRKKILKKSSKKNVREREGWEEGRERDTRDDDTWSISH